MNCKKCGKELLEDEMFCPECGEPVSDQSVENQNETETPLEETSLTEAQEEIEEIKTVEPVVETETHKEEPVVKGAAAARPLEVPTFKRFLNVEEEEKKEETKPVDTPVQKEEELPPQKPAKKKSFAWILSLIGFLAQIVSVALPWVYIAGKEENLLGLLLNPSKTTVFGFAALRSDFPLEWAYMLAIIFFGLGGVILSAARARKSTALWGFLNFIIVTVPTLYVIVYSIINKSLGSTRYGLYITLLGSLIALYSTSLYIRHFKDRA